jgi:hypothetical protein
MITVVSDEVPIMGIYNNPCHYNNIIVGFAHICSKYDEFCRSQS